jgi:glycosyl transferase, family 25
MHNNPMTFVINLPQRSDRRVQMQRELSRVGWSAEFFPAIRPETADGFPSVGARGCFLSHLSVLKTAYKANARRLVILEDDLDFAIDFQNQWRVATAELEKQKWSLYYPGHGLPNCPSGLSIVPPNTGVLCTHFMMINGEAIANFIVGLEAILSRPAGHPLGGPMHVDGAYSTIRSHDPSLITYVSFPPLGFQRPSRTDVGAVRWFDRIGVLAPMIGFARKLKAK